MAAKMSMEHKKRGKSLSRKMAGGNIPDEAARQTV
jgi:hypothetical protein